MTSCRQQQQQQQLDWLSVKCQSLSVTGPGVSWPPARRPAHDTLTSYYGRRFVAYD